MSTEQTRSLGELQELRALLKQEREIALERLATSEQDGKIVSERAQTGELSAIDNHPGDLATEVHDRGRDLALLNHDEERLTRIEDALQAMDEGRYGYCQTCHEAIPLERLQALPESLYCIQHSPRQELNDYRPVEEDILATFRETSHDTKYADGDRDEGGEDAWHIVQSWGNSDSPAMMDNPEEDYYNDYDNIQDAPEYVEPLESFLATDINGSGSNVTLIRNQAYYDYLEHSEGDRELEYLPEELDDTTSYE